MSGEDAVVVLGVAVTRLPFGLPGSLSLLFRETGGPGRGRGVWRSSPLRALQYILVLPSEVLSSTEFEGRCYWDYRYQHRYCGIPQVLALHPGWTEESMVPDPVPLQGMGSAATGGCLLK